MIHLGNERNKSTKKGKDDFIRMYLWDQVENQINEKRM